jgi:hypothetical protein
MTSKKLRILMMSQNYPDEFYTLGTFVRESVRAVARHAKVTMVSPRAYTIPIRGFPFHHFSDVPWKERDSVRGFEVYHPRYVYPVPKRFFYRFTGESYLAGLRRITLPKPDLIHAHFLYPDGYAAMKLASEWRVPLVCHLRGTEIRRVYKEWPAIRKKMDEVIKNSVTHIRLFVKTRFP